jgi:hypothetical protein
MILLSTDGNSRRRHSGGGGAEEDGRKLSLLSAENLSYQSNLHNYQSMLEIRADEEISVSSNEDDIKKRLMVLIDPGPQAQAVSRGRGDEGRRR